MKKRLLLSAILLVMVLYFVVIGVGYGKVFVPGESRTVGDSLADSFQESEYGNEPIMATY